MIGRIAYYGILYPMSLLPLPVLYVFTDLFYLILITLIPYRKDVIEGNLKRSFPNKTNKEIKRLRNRFYRHFTDLIAEGVKNFSMKKDHLLRRFNIENPELMDELYDQNRNVLLVSGHYNNWEWLISSQPLHFKHEAFGIGMPLSSKFWDKKLNERRSRFGMNVVHAKNYKEKLKESDDLNSVLILSDQSPGDAKRSYWTQFLNQNTPVLFGTELIAHSTNYAVVFFSTRKVKRGYYSIRLNTITTDPKSLSWGEITEAHTQLLEQQIIECPEFWLWSHKRWKREEPENLEELKNEQRKRFNEKFNY